nr:MAG: hypothetical protein 4 [Beijing sediment hepe-like virus 1]
MPYSPSSRNIGKRCSRAKRTCFLRTVAGKSSSMSLLRPSTKLRSFATTSNMSPPRSTEIKTMALTRLSNALSATPAKCTARLCSRVIIHLICRSCILFNSSSPSDIYQREFSAGLLKFLSPCSCAPRSRFIPLVGVSRYQSLIVSNPPSLVSHLVSTFL